MLRLRVEACRSAARVARLGVLGSESRSQEFTGLLFRVQGLGILLGSCSGFRV